MKSTHLIK